MPRPIVSKCWENCKHFLEMQVEEKKEGIKWFIFKCRAFPKGIPTDIYLWKIPHTKILSGQEGDFVFERKEK